MWTKCHAMRTQRDPTATRLAIGMQSALIAFKRARAFRKVLNMLISCTLRSRFYPPLVLKLRFIFAVNNLENLMKYFYKSSRNLQSTFLGAVELEKQRFRNTWDRQVAGLTQWTYKTNVPWNSTILTEKCFNLSTWCFTMLSARTRQLAGLSCS